MWTVCTLTRRLTLKIGKAFSTSLHLVLHMDYHHNCYNKFGLEHRADCDWFQYVHTTHKGTEVHATESMKWVQSLKAVRNAVVRPQLHLYFCDWVIQHNLISDHHCVCNACSAGTSTVWPAVWDVVQPTQVPPTPPAFLPTHWGWNITTSTPWHRCVYARCVVSAVNVSVTVPVFLQEIFSALTV